MATRSFEHETPPSSEQTECTEQERGRKGRPSFSTQKTSDRMRESERRTSIVASIHKKPLRRSIFREEGLDDLNTSVHILREGEQSPDTGPTDRRTEESPVAAEKNGNGKRSASASAKAGGLFSKLGRTTPGAQRRTGLVNSSAPPPAFATFPRAALVILLIAVVIPGFRYSSGGGESAVGAEADVIRTAEMVENGSLIEGRANSPTSVCTRWAHQAANVNGTLYIYGGEAKTAAGQTTNTWNNNLLALDLTKSWNRASPSLTGLPQPSGPPAVSLGALWHSYDSLFLYGGEFADNNNPPVSPIAVSTWEYMIKSASWTEWTNPLTSAGVNSAPGQQPVQRSAEGASLSVPELGKSWYFGGHLDMYTTLGWSNQIARVYLRSLLEFTHPGYANTGVYGLGSTVAAGKGGAYRNITQGGLQAQAGFTERADGVLVHIPGWGEEGILLGLAGGTNETFTEMNTIDIYDIANSTWYQQATSGAWPGIRVNPCAVVAAAPDGTSFNVYLYGGQNLIPFDQQVQYSDMWILTIPSFTWVNVSMDGQSQPPARAGHTCTMWDGQMVVVGGYVGRDISCDSPGIYVFNTSSLQWQNSFTSLSGTTYDDQGSSVLQGSVGYAVPAAVQSIIGGSSQGGATASTPAAGAATVGPLATGRSPIFTITRAGTTIIQTASPTSPSQQTSPPSSTTSSPSPSSPVAAKTSSTNTGTVAAGVVAGALACIALYLAFCTWLYRKRVKLYQNHVQMAQRSSFGVDPDPDAAWASDEMTGSSGGGGGVLLGPFGTEIGRTRTSEGVGSNERKSKSEPRSSESGGTRYGYGGGYGNGGGNQYPPQAQAGQGDTGYLSAGGAGAYGSQRGHDRNGGSGSGGSGGAAASMIGGVGRSSASVGSVGSQEDLLGGQEPSFFSVVLNPRRTLRVVNMD